MISAAPSLAHLHADLIRASQELGRAAATPGDPARFKAASERCEEVRKQLARIEETF